FRCIRTEMPRSRSLLNRCRFHWELRGLGYKYYADCPPILPSRPRPKDSCQSKMSSELVRSYRRSTSQPSAHCYLYLEWKPVRGELIVKLSGEEVIAHAPTGG